RTRPSPTKLKLSELKSSKPEVLAFPVEESTEKLTVAALGSFVGRTIAPAPRVEAGTTIRAGGFLFDAGVKNCRSPLPRANSLKPPDNIVSNSPTTAPA